MDLEERTKDVVGMTISLVLIVGAATLIGYIHDLKYGKTAQERYRQDSIKEVKYQDSLKQHTIDTSYIQRK
jgi:hypothetical protein